MPQYEPISQHNMSLKPNIVVHHVLVMKLFSLQRAFFGAAALQVVDTVLAVSNNGPIYRYLPETRGFEYAVNATIPVPAPYSLPAIGINADLLDCEETP